MTMLYTYNEADVIAQVESAYGFTIANIEKAGYGSGNWNFLIETSQASYLLCIIEEQTPAEVEVMAQTLNWLSRHQFPTTTLEITCNDELTININGKQALLRRFLTGDVQRNLISSQVSQVGTALGNLHLLPCPKFIPKNIYYTQPKFMQSLNTGIDQKYEEWVKSSLRRINISSYDTLPRGLIHADVFWDNVLFEGDDLVAIIDFELACNYLLAFDLAMSIVGLCMNGAVISPILVDSLISGYEKIRVLDEAERDALGTLTEYAATVTSLWRYWRYQCHEPGHKKQYSYLELVDVDTAHLNFKADSLTKKMQKY